MGLLRKLAEKGGFGSSGVIAASLISEGGRTGRGGPAGRPSAATAPRATPAPTAAARNVDVGTDTSAGSADALAGINTGQLSLLDIIGQQGLLSSEVSESIGGGVGSGNQGQRRSPELPGPTDQEIGGTAATIAAIEAQLSSLQQSQELQRALFDQFPGLFNAANFAAGEAGERTGISDEDRAVIEESIQNALRLGESDIGRFRDESLESLRSTLAPELGLRPGDTPIIDRGSRIVQESLRQQGQLERGLRSTVADQQFAREQLQQVLRQNAFQNRLSLAGTGANLGLALNPGINIPGALNVLQAPRLAEKQVSAAGSPSGGNTFGSVATGLGNLGQGIASIGNLQTGSGGTFSGAIFN